MQPTGAIGGRQARPLFRAPDLLTALRVPLAAAFLLYDDPVVRLAIVIGASVSDLADGIWARRIGGSRMGVVLDPVCDKVFLVSAFLVLWRGAVLTPIEFVGILIRDIVALVAFLGTLVLRRPTTLPARAGGKAVTVFQFLTLLAFLGESDLVRPLAWMTAGISLYAIADYGRVAWRR